MIEITLYSTLLSTASRKSHYLIETPIDRNSKKRVRQFLPFGRALLSEFALRLPLPPQICRTED